MEGQPRDELRAWTAKVQLLKRMDGPQDPWVWFGCCQPRLGNSRWSKGRSLLSVKDPGYSPVLCKFKALFLLSASVAVYNLSNWQDSWLKTVAFLW